MTVKLHVRPSSHTERISDGSSEGFRSTRNCPGCGTKYVIVVVTERIRIDVNGRSCDLCNASKSHCPPPEDLLERDGITRLFTIWWASRNLSEPRLEVREILSRAGSAKAWHADRKEMVRPTTPDEELRDPTWTTAISARVTQGFGGGWDTVRSAWHPGLCSYLADLADAVQWIWSTIGPHASGTTRLVVRLTGMPLAAAALGAALLRQTALTSRPRLVVDPTHALRLAGAIACVGSGNVVDCPCAARMAEIQSRPLDVAFLEELIGELPPGAVIGVFAPEPARQAVISEDHPPASNGLEDDQKAIRGPGVPVGRQVFGAASA